MARKCKSMVGFTYVELPFLIVAAACFCGKMMLLNRMHMYEIPKKWTESVIFTGKSDVCSRSSGSGPPSHLMIL